MDDPSSISSVELKLFEQHWDHLRHIEGQRLTLTNIFAVVMAGMLGFLSVHHEMAVRYVVLVFLLFFSLFGFGFCIKVRALHEGHKQLGDWRLRILHHGQFAPSMEAGTKKEPIFLSISGIFVSIYAVVFSLLASAIVWFLFRDLPPKTSVVPIILVVLIVFTTTLWRLLSYDRGKFRENLHFALVPLSPVECSQCPQASRAKYVLWADRRADETERRRGRELFQQLIEEDHRSSHTRPYAGVTLGDLAWFEPELVKSTDSGRSSL